MPSTCIFSLSWERDSFLCMITGPTLCVSQFLRNWFVWNPLVYHESVWQLSFGGLNPCFFRYSQYIKVMAKPKRHPSKMMAKIKAIEAHVFSKNMYCFDSLMMFVSIAGRTRRPLWLSWRRERWSLRSSMVKQPWFWGFHHVSIMVGETTYQTSIFWPKV